MSIQQHRLRLELRGAVQGVGFRPFVYRLARELRLAGFVRNTPQGAVIEVEGAEGVLTDFARRVHEDRPSHCRVDACVGSIREPIGSGQFVIEGSAEEGTKAGCILPDLASCADCLREVFDPRNPRYRYPFTNCTHCGPRFSIVEGIPYDRARTTMKVFALCDACRREYEDPADRRFHAQPNACPICGPAIALWDRHGRTMASGDDALRSAVQEIQRGKIVAIKGLGGFHLFVDARNEDAVRLLRARKRRDEKPFAVMFPDLQWVHDFCECGADEAAWLNSAAAPIVVVRRKKNKSGGKAPYSKDAIAASVAPGNPYVGALLPYTPLHHLLMAGLRFPVVATSGNVSDEPICIDEGEVVERLGGIADVFLVHNRPIARAMEDSVMQIAADCEQMLRVGRGFAPLTLALPGFPSPVLALGGHLKNTVALSIEDRVVVSQHHGDLDTLEARRSFEQSRCDLPRLYDAVPKVVVCDLHPDYVSTHAAEQIGAFIHRVQHHEAHIRACMLEHGVTGSVLGVAWDGTGYGTDGVIWGGEFLHLDGSSCRRVASLRPFRLPGGEAAIREPRRAALGVLFEVFGDDFSEHANLRASDHNILAKMLQIGLQAPKTTSIGRLFDAVASLCGLRHVSRFEGQAAMDLQFAAEESSSADEYTIAIRGDGTLDWEPMIREVLADLRKDDYVSAVSAKFHRALASTVVEVARRTGESRVVLGGGCFQNRLLLELTITKLRSAGFEVYWPQRVPPNDGGLALGQLAAYFASQE